MSTSWTLCCHGIEHQSSVIEKTCSAEVELSCVTAQGLREAAKHREFSTVCWSKLVRQKRLCEGRTFVGSRWVCDIKRRIARLVTWRESFQQTLLNAFFRSTFPKLESFPFSSASWLQSPRQKKKRDSLITVIHMKWIVYLQLNPAVLAPCGFPPVSIPICWLNFLPWRARGNSSASFSLDFHFHLTTGPPRRAGRKWKPRRDETVEDASVITSGSE